jgi:hypothetical protein
MFPNKKIKKMFPCPEIAPPILTMKPATAIMIMLIVVLSVLFSIQIGMRHRNAELAQPWTLSSAEIKYINEALNKKSVGDCGIEPTYYGWKCTDRDGRVYRIVRM